MEHGVKEDGPAAPDRAGSRLRSVTRAAAWGLLGLTIGMAAAAPALAAHPVRGPRPAAFVRVRTKDKLPPGSPSAITATFDQRGKAIAHESVPVKDLHGRVVQVPVPKHLRKGVYVVVVALEYGNGSFFTGAATAHLG
jgi:methionine-rich copper-binding protein CopC